MIVNTPDEAYHICTKYAPDCIGSGEYGSVHVSFHSQSIHSSSPSNGSFTSYTQSRSSGSATGQIDRAAVASVSTVSASSGNQQHTGHREFVDLSGDVEGLEIIGEDDDYYNNLELEGETKRQTTTSTQRSYEERYRVDPENLTSFDGYDQYGRRPILPLPDPEFDSSATNNGRPGGQPPDDETKFGGDPVVSEV